MARKLIPLIFLLMSLNSLALAVEPDEVLADPALEERARVISRYVRCVVCQSQNIDDSNAPLAKDMRVIVRERLLAGESDEQVFDYLVSRYGDYVLLKPRVQSNTILLWAAPALLLLIGTGAAGLYLANMKKEDDEAISADANPREETAA